MTDKNSPPPASVDEQIAGLSKDELALFNYVADSHKEFLTKEKLLQPLDKQIEVAHLNALSVIEMAREAGDIEERLETFRKMDEFDNDKTFKLEDQRINFPTSLPKDFKLRDGLTENILKRKL